LLKEETLILNQTEKQLDYNERQIAPMFNKKDDQNKFFNEFQT